MAARSGQKRCTGVRSNAGTLTPSARSACVRGTQAGSGRGTGDRTAGTDHRIHARSRRSVTSGAGNARDIRAERTNASMLRSFARSLRSVRGRRARKRLLCRARSLGARARATWLRSRSGLAAAWSCALIRRGVLCTSMTRPSLSYTSSSHPLQISVPARTRLPTRPTRPTRGFAPAGGAAVTSPASARGTERIARRMAVEATSELAYVTPSQTLGGAFEMQPTDESKLA